MMRRLPSEIARGGQIDELSKMQRIDDRGTATGARTGIRRASMHQLRIGLGFIDTTKPAEQPAQKRFVHAGCLKIALVICSHLVAGRTCPATGSGGCGRRARG
ncbi:hypothetical protein NITLEN_20249 [Nitrospira lenta]|uniref:Uncharacterized protein n=1 Tax=Nitrospira lenta TaxID=1436998 RepID=A0A330LC68_9BACT|nr:hypothetical protein NITLEN_20249 [Nitrospira lenta]